jgi:hypothetical protein
MSARIPDRRSTMTTTRCTGKLVKLTVDLGETTVTPEALHDLQEVMAARGIPIIGWLVGDFEDFIQRMKQGNGP